MSRWYYKDDGADAGPFTLDEMRGLIAQGSVMPGTIVWTRGMADWLPAGRTELAPLFQAVFAAEAEAEVPPPLPQAVESPDLAPATPDALDRLYPGLFANANDMISPPPPPDFREDPGGAAADPGWMEGEPWRDGPPADDPAWQQVLNPDPVFGAEETAEEAVALPVADDEADPRQAAIVDLDELPEEEHDQFDAFRERLGRWLTLQIALLVFAAIFLVFALRNGSELLLGSAIAAAVLSLPVHFYYLGICWSVVPGERRSGEPLMQLPLLLVPGVNIFAAPIVINNMDKDLTREYQRVSPDPAAKEYSSTFALHCVSYMIVNGMFLWGSIMKVETIFVLVQALFTGAFLIGTVFFSLQARRPAEEIRLRQIMRDEKH